MAAAGLEGCRAENPVERAETGEVPEGGAEVPSEGCGRPGEALEAARGAEAAHQKPEVEGGGLNQDPFSDVLPAANVDAAESSRLQHVREAPLQLLAPLAQQSLPPVPPDPPAVGVGRLLGVPVPLPVAPSPVGLAHVAPQSPVPHPRHRLVRVVSLVRHHFLRFPPPPPPTAAPPRPASPAARPCPRRPSTTPSPRTPPRSPDRPPARTCAPCGCCRPSSSRSAPPDRADEPSPCSRSVLLAVAGRKLYFTGSSNRVEDGLFRRLELRAKDPGLRPALTSSTIRSLYSAGYRPRLLLHDSPPWLDPMERCPSQRGNSSRAKGVGSPSDSCPQRR